MPLVLTANDPNVSEHYNWKDITGVQYHYPNIYRNLIKPGARFIYYRGMRRSDGSRRPAEYFGCGVVGAVWPDPETQAAPPIKRAWYCSIEDYVPFHPSVPAKIAGILVEEIPKNLWRSGVRQLPDTIFEKIMTLAGSPIVEPAAEASTLKVPPLEDVAIPASTSILLVPRKKTLAPGTTSGANRRSKYAKAVGDRAELIALRWIKSRFPDAVDILWVANEGATPGWDIQFKDATGALYGVEVKGSTGALFTGFDLTANELAAAKQLRERYLILLIADCVGTHPKIEVIENIAVALEDGLLKSEPATWRISKGLQQAQLLSSPSSSEPFSTVAAPPSSM